jgi:hypothetical protein
MSTVRIQVRRGTATDWTTANPTLAAGEVGFETTTNKIKVGDGSTAWSSLSYISSDAPGVGEIAQDAIAQALSVGSGILKTYDDNANTISLSLDNSIVQNRVANVSDTEIGYLDGVTSAIQTQLNAKAAAADITELAQDAVNAALTAGTGITKTYNDAANTITVTNSGVLSFNTRTGAVTLSAADVNNALGYTAADALDITGLAGQTSADITNAITTAEGYTDTQVADAISTAEQYADNAIQSLTTNAAYFTHDLTARNFITTGDVSADDVHVGGNLYVSGSTTTVNSQTLNVSDPIIYVGADNTANLLDLGIVGSFTDNSGYQHTGLVRDASENSWKLFKGVTTEPGSTINFTQGSLDNLKMNVMMANEAYIGNVTNTEIQSLQNIPGRIVDLLAEKASLAGNVTFTGTVNLPDNTVGTSDIETGAVTTAKIATAGVTSVKIEDGAISSAKIADGAVTTAKISDTAVTTAKIADNNITSSKIATSAVSSSKIEDGAVSSTKISDGAVTTAKISDSSITSAKIADGTIATADIADLAITSAKIGNGSISDSHISSSAAIAVSKIDGLQALLDAKQSASSASASLALKANLDAPTFTGVVVLPSTTSIGNVSDVEIGYLDGVTSSVQTQISSKASSSSVSSHTSATTNVHGISDTAALATKTYADGKASDALTTAEGYTDSAIATEVTNRNSAITTATANVVKTTDTGTVTSAMIANGTIATVDIADGAITSAKIADGTIATVDIADGAITSAKILDGTIVDGDISSSAAIATSKISGLDTALAAKAPLASPTFTGTVAGITKSMVGLGNVDNTSDANKPVSTATQTALDAKLALAGGTMTGALTLSGAPTSDLHAATKAYVDGVTAGINFHKSVRIATATNWSAVYANGTNGYGATLTASANQSINPADGVTLAVGDRILVKSQTDAKQNGIYDVTSIGGASSKWVLTRSADADNNPNGEVAGGDFTFVTEGSTNANTGFILSSPSGTAVIGTDNISYTQFNAAQAIVAGTGLAKSGGTISIDTATTVDLNTAQTLTNKTITGTFTGPLTGNVTGNTAGTHTGAVVGNASTATTLATPRNINGVAFDGSAAITITAANPNALTIGTGLSGTSYTGSGAVTIAIDSTVATLTGTQTLTNKTLTSPTITLPSAGITFSDGTVQTVAGTPSLTPISAQIGSITLGASFVKDSFIQMTVGSANSVTIPTDATYNYPIGASIDFQQTGTGQTSFVAASGVTFQASSVNGTMALKLRGQFSVATALKVAANTWAIFGDLSI